jgi:hypothetical protein
MAKFHAQDCALKAFHAVVVSTQHVVIFAVLPPVAQHTNRLRIFWIVRRYCAAFAVRPQIFGRIKAKASNVADTSDGAPLVLRTVCLGSIFNNDQSMASRHFHDRIHVG